MSASVSTSAHLEAAQDYLGLGMAQDAWDELEKISKSGRVDFVAVWKVQVEVARVLGKWKLVGELSRRLAKVEPEDSLHVCHLAEAMRHRKG